MKKIYEKPTAEVYEEYVRNCQKKEQTPMSKLGFSRAFLIENPEYVVKVKKPDCRKSVKFFVLQEPHERIRVSQFIWDKE